MKPLRHHPLIRFPVVALLLMGWFVLSNHCALGGLARRSATMKMHTCCHNGTAKPAHEPADREPATQCCKSLHALVPNGEKLAEQPALFATVVIAWVVAAEVAAESSLLPAGDTGPPPRAESFSELVLHRSLRSHAPPFLA